MSINDLIATSSVHAFNQGVSTGRKLERERIARIVEELGIDPSEEWAAELGQIVFIKDLTDYMKDEENK